jgi:hypothetical protein
MKSPDVIERLTRGGVDVVLSTSQQAFADFVAAETRRWGQVAKEAERRPTDAERSGRWPRLVGPNHRRTVEGQRQAAPVAASMLLRVPRNFVSNMA